MEDSQGDEVQKQEEMAVQMGMSLGLGRKGFKGEALQAGREGRAVKMACVFSWRRRRRSQELHPRSELQIQIHLSSKHSLCWPALRFPSVKWG